MNMIKFSKLSIVVFILTPILLFVSNVYSAYDTLIPQRQRGKFFTPSIRIRSEYNDNVSGNRGSAGGRGLSERRIKSMIQFWEPKVSLRLPLDQTYFGIDYKYSLAYYWARPYDNEDVAHEISARFKHSFSPRLNLDLQEDYISYEAGTIKRSGIEIRDKGDFERNTVNVALKYDISRSLYLRGKYGFEFVDFETRSSSQTFDYRENMIAYDLGYIINKDLTFYQGYTFRDRQYELRQNADYDSHLLFGGFNYRMGKYFTVDAYGGVDFRKLESPTYLNYGWDFGTLPQGPSSGVLASPLTPNEIFGVRRGSSKLDKNPYVKVQLTTNYFKNMVLSWGYLYVTQTTEQEEYNDAQSQMFSFQMSYRFTPKISLDFNMVYGIDEYDGRVYLAYVNIAQAFLGAPNAGSIDVVKLIALDNPETKSFRLGAVLSYQLTPWLFYELGYKRTDFDSDYEGSTWERNQYFTGVNAIF